MRSTSLLLCFFSAVFVAFSACENSSKTPPSNIQQHMTTNPRSVSNQKRVDDFPLQNSPQAKSWYKQQSRDFRKKQLATKPQLASPNQASPLTKGTKEKTRYLQRRQIIDQRYLSKIQELRQLYKNDPATYTKQAMEWKERILKEEMEKTATP